MNAFRSPMETLEDRQMFAVTIKGTDIQNIIASDKTKDNGQIVTVKFSGAVKSPDASKMRMFGYRNDTINGGQFKQTINIKSATVGSDGKSLVLTTDVQIRKGSQFTLQSGALQDSGGAGVTGTTRVTKGLNRDRFTLALRAFHANDPTYFASSAITGGSAAVSTSSAESEATVKAALTSFLDKKVKAKTITAAQETNALNLFNSDASKLICAPANLRAAIVSLVGTIGEPAINAFLGSANSTGKVPITITFNSGDIGSGAKDAELTYTSKGRMKLTFANDYVGESFVALSGRFAHEILHDGGSTAPIDSQDEETVANYVESVVYSQQIVNDFTYAQKHTAYTMFMNYRALIAINSGDRQFPRTGINQAPLKTGTVANPGFKANGDYSFANVTSFHDSIIKEYTGRIGAKAPTPTTSVACTILNNLTGNKYTASTTTFGDTLVKDVDISQDVMGDAFVMRVARVLQVTV